MKNSINNLWNEFKNNLINNNFKYCLEAWNGCNIFFMKKYFAKEFKNIQFIEFVENEWIDKESGVITLYDKKFEEYKNIFYLKDDEKFKFAWPVHLKSRYYLRDYKKLQLSMCNIFYRDKLEHKEAVNLNEFIEKQSELLETKVKKPLNIYMIKQDQMRILSNTEEIDGFFDPVRGDIFILEKDENIAHEIMHGITYNWDGWPSAIIHEGLAETFKIPINVKMFINKIFLGEKFSLTTFINDEEDVDLFKYPCMGLFLRFLYEKNDVKTLKKLYLINSERNLEESCELILEEKFEIIEHEWENWVNEFITNNREWDSLNIDYKI